MNKIFPDEKTIRVGRYKYKLCLKDGCDKPRAGKKYCHEHRYRDRDRYHKSGKSKIRWADLHGQKFFDAWDRAWGLDAIQEIEGG